MMGEFAVHTFPCSTRRGVPRTGTPRLCGQCCQIGPDFWQFGNLRCCSQGCQIGQEIGVVDDTESLRSTRTTCRQRPPEIAGDTLMTLCVCV